MRKQSRRPNKGTRATDLWPKWKHRETGKEKMVQRNGADAVLLCGDHTQEQKQTPPKRDTLLILNMEMNSK